MKQEDKILIEKYLKQGYDKEYIKEKFRLMSKDDYQNSDSPNLNL